MEWFVLIGLVVALFVVTAMLKTLIGLVLRYLLFVGIAVVVVRQERGGELASVLDGPEAARIAIIAAGAFLATNAVGLVLLKGNRFRFLLMPIIGLVATVLLARVVG